MVDVRELQKIMKQMQTEKLEATEAVFKLRDRELVIEKPQIVKMTVMGQTTFQVTGTVTERSSDDVKLVMGQTGATRASAEAALRETGDIAAAIMKLKS